MDVYDFCYLCTEEAADVRIYDMNTGVEKEVFIGTMLDAMSSEFAYSEVKSFDLCGGNIHDGYAPLIVLNIDTSEN